MTTGAENANAAMLMYLRKTSISGHFPFRYCGLTNPMTSEYYTEPVSIKIP